MNISEQIKEWAKLAQKESDERLGEGKTGYEKFDSFKSLDDENKNWVLRTLVDCLDKEELKKRITEWDREPNDKTAEAEEFIKDIVSVNETNYPCTDGFPQAEKDICTCPDCGEKMYENAENPDDPAAEMGEMGEDDYEDSLNRGEEVDDKVFDFLKNLIGNNSDAEVISDEDGLHIGFDSSAYDNGYQAKQGFEAFKDYLKKAIMAANRKELAGSPVNLEDENDYTLKVVAL